ncbi:hypothetical protein BJY04DRAFT_217319 [Aspergillus karnatakaensis]|uniref:DUF3716 domain-containing protein n=1 Tax=Aspergillus karnatakaensis TaxID=1810916 RepID=UPI003CCE3680
MSSLFEAYGLARSQSQSQSPEDEPPCLVNTSIKPPTKTSSKNSDLQSVGLGPNQTQIVNLLEPVRELEWSSGVAKEPKDAEQRSAALLYCRGEAVEPCSQCARQTPWSKCVVFPIYQNRSMYTHACSNCIFQHRGVRCDHRLAFEKQGGKVWDPKVTVDIVARGGLRQVLAEEATRSASPSETAVATDTSTSPITQKRKLAPMPTESVSESPAQRQIQLSLRTTTESETESSAQRQVMPSPKKPRLSAHLLPVSQPLRAKSAFDGEYLPWPVTPAAWNDPIHLRSIINDLKLFAAIAEARLKNLETPMSLAEYWEQEAAKLSGDK